MNIRPTKIFLALALLIAATAAAMSWTPMAHWPAAWSIASKASLANFLFLDPHTSTTQEPLQSVALALGPDDCCSAPLSDEEYKRQLSQLEYYVTRERGTEQAFTGAYWDEHRPGTYCCVCCSAPLFASAAKFDSGTGWPSFDRPYSAENVTARDDISLFVRRTEATCSNCGAHLGHVFADGPKPTGLRYCINSAALRFEPAGEQVQTQSAKTN